jgi:hypothetical protein
VNARTMRRGVWRPTILENPAGQVATQDRQQEFGASVDPLYLFSCGMLWHQQRDASAGWELIQFLRSKDKGTRAIAAALLAKTEHARLLVRDLRRARAHVAKPATSNVGCRDGHGPSKVAEMNTPSWVGNRRELSHVQAA